LIDTFNAKKRFNSNKKIIKILKLVKNLPTMNKKIKSNNQTRAIKKRLTYLKYHKDAKDANRDDMKTILFSKISRMRVKITLSKPRIISLSTKTL